MTDHSTNLFLWLSLSCTAISMGGLGGFLFFVVVTATSLFLSCS